MKDGMRSAVTRMPLPSPISAPQPMPVATPSSGEPVSLITLAARQADSATLAPIERSRPAVKMTSVRPEAIRNNSADCRSTLRMLFVVMNTSLNSPSTTQISATASRR